VIAEDLDTLDPEQLRQALRAARAEVAYKQAVIDKLTHENAILKRLKFAAKSEAYNAEQKSLLEETLDSDLAAVAAEIEAMGPSNKAAGDKVVSRDRSGIVMKNIPPDLRRHSAMAFMPASAIKSLCQASGC
jgi:hypothetical protein